GAGEERAAQPKALAVDRPTQIEDRFETGHANGNVDQSFAPGTSKGIGDNYSATAQPVAEAVGGSIGVGRQQGRVVIAGDVRSVDSRIGGDEAVPGLGDD